jgi:ATP-dependent RNA helicase DDX49/DBP8
LPCRAPEWWRRQVVLFYPALPISPSLSQTLPCSHTNTPSTLTVERLKQKYIFIPSQIRDPYLYYLLTHPPEDIDAALRLPAKTAIHPMLAYKGDGGNPKKKRFGKGKPGQQQKRKREDSPDDGESDEPPIPPTIIFTQRCATAHLLHLLLVQLEIPSVPLHSHLTQPQRLESLAKFRAREVPVLVTTDVGSRGLDIPQVAMVVNWDCPRRADDYVHRVGRTARAGRGGVAVTIVTERDVELVKSIEDEVKVTLQELCLPEEPVLENLNKVSIARRVAGMVSPVWNVVVVEVCACCVCTFLRSKVHAHCTACLHIHCGMAAHIAQHTMHAYFFHSSGANIIQEMHDSKFGERRAVNQAKAIKRARRDAMLK